jgi:hypothetical protein
MMILTAFIGFGAVSEYRGLVMHRSLKGLRVSSLISNDYVVVKPKDNIAGLINDLLRVRTFTVLVEGKPFKVADMRSIRKFPEAKRPKLAFSDVAISVPKFTLRSSAESVYSFLANNDVGMAPVYDGNCLAGVVKLPDIERARQSAELLKG